jgi:excisionase family DNA binding protein
MEQQHAQSETTKSSDVLLVTDNEAQKLLRLSRRTLIELRKAGRLAYVKVGKAVRYRPEDLRAFIDAQRRLDQPQRRRRG